MISPRFLPPGRKSAHIIFWHVNRRKIRNLTDGDIVKPDDGNIGSLLIRTVSQEKVSK